jgi:hypothetical protein
MSCRVPSGTAAVIRRCAMVTALAEHLCRAGAGGERVHKHISEHRAFRRLWHLFCVGVSPLLANETGAVRAVSRLNFVPHICPSSLKPSNVCSDPLTPPQWNLQVCDNLYMDT